MERRRRASTGSPHSCAEVRGRRLDIIVHDTRYLESACPRMLRPAAAPTATR